MTESDFQHAVQSGLGRAIIFTRANDAAAFRDLILDACLRCYAADAQAEGTRAAFALELANATAERDFYHREIVRSLESSADDWDTVHRFRLATYLAMDGIDEARRAMYRHFRPGPTHGEMIGIDFVELDGPEGLLFAARHTGRLLRQYGDEVDAGCLFSYSVEHLGEQQVVDTLLHAANADPDVATYIRTALEQGARTVDWRRRRELILGLTYAELKPKLRELSFYSIGRWGEKASADDLAVAARELPTDRPPGRRACGRCDGHKRRLRGCG